MDKIIKVEGFTVIDNFTMSQLSWKGKLVYWALAMRASSETHTAFPSQRRIAEDVGIGVSTVKATIAELVESGCLRKTTRFTGKGGRTSDLYLVTRIDRVTATPSQQVASPPSGDDYPPSQEMASNQMNTNHIKLKGVPVKKFMYLWNRSFPKYKAVGWEASLIKKLAAEIPEDQMENVISQFIGDRRIKDKTLKQLYFNLGSIVNSEKGREGAKLKSCPHCGSGSYKGSGDTVECLSCTQPYSRVVA